MNIVVCLKQVLDPEIPARDFKINAERREAERGSANLVTSIFCANALETALQFRDAHGGKISVLTYGAAAAEDILRKSIALKADDAVLVLNDQSSSPDPLHIAGILAAAIKKIGGVDLILVGRNPPTGEPGRPAVSSRRFWASPASPSSTTSIWRVKVSRFVDKPKRDEKFSAPSPRSFSPSPMTITICRGSPRPRTSCSRRENRSRNGR